MAEDFEFYIDIENAAGKVGPGPITSATRWTYTESMDKAGPASFSMLASDPMAAFILPKRKARAWALIGGIWTEVGAMIIDHIERKLGDDGITTLIVSGDNELRELAGWAIMALDLSGAGAGVTHADALTAISFYRSTDWVYIPAATPGNDFVYGKFAGESTLAALIEIANKTLTHFYRSGPRTLTFVSAFTPSGIRAIQADADSLAAETCAIVGTPTLTIDTYDFLTHIHPYGAGNGEVRVNITNTSRSAPVGFQLDRATNALFHIDSYLEFGVIDFPPVEFKSVRAISNTDADVQAASDALFDLALKELKRRISQRNTVYGIKLANCGQLLHPMQTLRLVYQDTDAGLDIDQDLNILSATWEITSEGIQTTSVDLATSDSWPESDTDAVVARMAESSIYQAHPQVNANAYVIPFSKNLDDDRSNPAEFRFRFDQEVLQVIRVCFDFKFLPLESTVKSIGGSSVSTAASGDHTHTVTIGTHTHGVTIGDHTHTATTSNHAHTVSIGTHTHGVTISGHTHTLTIHGTTGDPTATRPFARVAYFDATNDNFYADIGSGTDGSATSSSGGSSTPTTASGGSSTPTSSSGGGETVTSSSGGGTTATSASGGSSTPTSATGGNHTHTLTASVSTVYGVYRDSPSNVYNILYTEYSLDGATWYYWIPGVNGFEDLGDGWHRVDLTELLHDPSSFRPLSANNVLQIRRKSITVPIGQHATIDAQLSIRTTIQSIAFS